MRKLVATIGDMHPLTEGGGLIFKVTGEHKGGSDYEMDWLDYREEYDGRDGKVVRSTVLLESVSDTDWFMDDLDRVASYVGSAKEAMLEDVRSNDPRRMAWFYDSLIRYHGAENFDSYPDTFSLGEARRKYATMFRHARKRGIEVYAA